MPIYEGIFKLDEFEEAISINTIEDHPRFAEVRSNLYCAYQNCSVKLEYVPKGKYKAHFKTWPKNDHSADCLDYFEREKTARSTKSLATSTMALSDKHIANILNDVKRKRKNLDNNVLTKSGSSKKKTRPRVDTALPENSPVNINPTTGGDADFAEGDIKIKAPSVRRRTLLLLNDNDIGFTHCLWDVLIDSVEVSTEGVIINVYKGKHNCKIYFEEFFFTTAPVNFMDRFVELKNVVNKNKELFFSCVGEVIKRNDKIHMMVNKHSNFRVNDFPLTLFLHNYGNSN